MSQDGYLHDQINLIKTWLGTGSINLFGLPFSGKDTQGERLEEALGAVRISGGAIIRENPEHSSVKSIIDRGRLAPSEKYLQIVTPYLSKPEFAGKSLILSSVGRWTGEEAGVIEAAQKSGHPLKAVIYLKVEEQAIWQRWKVQDHQAGFNRGFRDDDDAETLEVRLQEFREKTLPVINFYRHQNLLIEIDGESTANEVYTRIIQRLAELAKQ